MLMNIAVAIRSRKDSDLTLERRVSSNVSYNNAEKFIAKHAKKHAVYAYFVNGDCLPDIYSTKFTKMGILK